MKQKFTFFSPITVFLIIPLCFGILNALLSLFAKFIESPLFLDSFFTAASSLVFGLVPGILTVLWTHLFMEIFSGFGGIWFPWIVTSIGTVLSVRLVYRISQNLDVAVFLNTILVTTLVNALLGTVISIFVFKAERIHPSDLFVTGFLMLGKSEFIAFFWSRILINLIDKSIAIGGAFSFYLFIHHKYKNQKNL